ncbi:MAG: TIGR03619 family F420-dependent LLM class oxidoreductase [Geodermatophilaceae bacterium]|jgi:probable F420-dependent oxidoreductase|nr:TIGR03619 family F420-dependent LLM class oxidoreductase [Geodermatophilaceae bacterium]
MQIGFGVPVSGSWATPEAQRTVVQRAEELGYHSVWTFQRLLVPEPADDGRWAEVYRSVQDPIVTLAYLAGLTRRVRLGVAVLNMPFMSPTVLAKQLTTLDLVSHGRLDVGLGLGWAPAEFIAAGASFPRRGQRAEEFLEALQRIWTEEVTEFHGEFYEIPPSRVEPKPAQRPHPPILLGGFAAAALRRAGRLADGWISSSRADLTAIGESIDTIKAAAVQAGRDPSLLRFVCRGVVQIRAGGSAGRRLLTGSAEEIRTDFDVLADQGVTELFLDLNYDPEIGSNSADPEESVRRAEEALAAFAPT